MKKDDSYSQNNFGPMNYRRNKSSGGFKAFLIITGLGIGAYYLYQDFSAKFNSYTQIQQYERQKEKEEILGSMAKMFQDERQKDSLSTALDLEKATNKLFNQLEEVAKEKPEEAEYIANKMAYQSQLLQDKADRYRNEGDFNYSSKKDEPAISLVYENKEREIRNKKSRLIFKIDTDKIAESYRKAKEWLKSAYNGE